jgi:hypothetical protein
MLSMLMIFAKQLKMREMVLVILIYLPTWYGEGRDAATGYWSALHPK